MSDQENLRDAIKWARSHAAVFGSVQPSYPLLLADAAESTLLRTKMVEVWRVEFAHGSVPHVYHFTKEDEARSWERSPPHCYSCIRVTGPHMQEIPA